MKTVDLKDEYRTETNEDVYATMENYGAYTYKYVKWLESKLKSNEALDLVMLSDEQKEKYYDLGFKDGADSAATDILNSI